MDVNDTSLPVTAAQKAAATRARNRVMQEEADIQLAKETGEQRRPFRHVSLSVLVRWTHPTSKAKSER
jgi:hypothetical protein